MSVYETDIEFGSTDSRQTLEFRLKTGLNLNIMSLGFSRVYFFVGGG